MPSEAGLRGPELSVPLRKPPKYEIMMLQIVEMAEAGSGVNLISRSASGQRPSATPSTCTAPESGRRAAVKTAAAVRDGRKPTRPPYKWSEESRAARRKPRD